ncbi:MAG: hypothetical protein JWP35_2195 [Caulobacter sp.]|nr:hypothetical protein [Caulobacter sp.]
MPIPAPVVRNLNALLGEIHRANSRVKGQFAKDRHALIGASLDLVELTPPMMLAARNAQTAMDALAHKLLNANSANEHEIEPLRAMASHAVTQLATTFVDAKPSQMTVVLGQGW